MHMVFVKKISGTADYLEHHPCCHVGAAVIFLLSAGASVGQTQASPPLQGCLAASQTASILVCSAYASIYTTPLTLHHVQTGGTSQNTAGTKRQV